MPAIVDIVTTGVRSQVENVRALLTTPVGPFETVDKMIRQTRTTGRQVIQTAGVRVPAAPRLLRGRRL